MLLRLFYVSACKSSLYVSERSQIIFWLSHLHVHLVFSSLFNSVYKFLYKCAQVNKMGEAKDMYILSFERFPKMLSKETAVCLIKKKKNYLVCKN